MSRRARPTPIALARVPLPKPREHASGYIRRLTDENRLLLKDFRRLLGIRFLSPRSNDLTWERVADRLGVPSDVLEPLRWRSHTKNYRWLSFLGNEVYESYLHHEIIRVCRLCLAEGSIVDSAWSIRHITACPTHQVRLTACCGRCGKQQSLITAYSAWSCPHCGSDIRLGTISAANEDELAIAEWLYAALEPGRPAPRANSIGLRPQETSLAEMLTTLEYLGCLTALTAADQLSARPRPYHAGIFPAVVIDDERQRTANARALSILESWPSKYRLLLESLLDKHPDPPKATPLVRRFASEAGLYAIRPLKNRGQSPFPFITEERLRFLRERTGYRPRARVVRRNPTGFRTDGLANVGSETNLLSVEAARELVMGTGGSLSPFIAAGFLNPIKEGDRVAAFLLEEAQALASAFERLPELPAARPDLVPAKRVLRDAIRIAAATDFLQDLLSGTLEAYSSGPRLRDVYLPKEEALHCRSRWKLKAWTSRSYYADLAKFNREAKRLWGPMGIYSTLEANQLVAAGSLRFKRANFYTRRGEARLYHVGDLIRDIQSWLGPFLIDVDAIEPALPVFD